MHVEVRHLRSFVAVAEELNFTRAAEGLHLAQQALSAQIQQLEERVGAQLFIRTSRKVALTPAGHALLEQAPALLSALESAVETARQAGQGASGKLTVGLLATAALDVTPRLLRAFAAARPGVEVSLRNISIDEPSGGVATGEADVSIVWLPFRSERLAIEPLYDDPRLAVLPADHPLAERDTLHIADILDEPFPWVEGLDPVALEFWTLGGYRAGRPPKIGAHVFGFEEILASIRAGKAIAAVPASISGSLPFADVVVRPVADLPPATVALCWRPHEPNPLVEAFVEVARGLSERAS
jgi:DNA-binding transcriptional LysR family regulator